MYILGITIASPEHSVKHHPQQQSSEIDDKPYRKYDRVEAFDVNGKSVKGAVKWIGKNEPNGVYIVGIHTVSASVV